MERIDSGFILYHALSTRDSITISDLVGIKAQIEDFDKRFLHFWGIPAHLIL